MFLTYFQIVVASHPDTESGTGQKHNGHCECCHHIHNFVLLIVNTVFCVQRYGNPDTFATVGYDIMRTLHGKNNESLLSKVSIAKYFF